jgi:uncharacterized RDD family membrane protein YckC
MSDDGYGSIFEDEEPLPSESEPAPAASSRDMVEGSEEKCPKCGELNTRGTWNCWACNEPLQSHPTQAQPAAPVGTPVEPAHGPAAPGYGYRDPATVFAQPVLSYVGFWPRFLALFIDNIILQVAAYIVTFAIMIPLGIVGAATGGEEGMSTGLSIGQLIAFAPTLVMGWLYFAWMDSSPHQGTLGKIVMGIKITDLEGQRIGFGQATWRYFAKIISTIVCYLGLLAVAWDPRHQGWHDHLASTFVVRR